MSTRSAAAQRLHRKYGPAWAATLDHPGLTFRRVERAIRSARHPWRIAAWTAGGAFIGVLAAYLVLALVKVLAG